MNKTHQEMLPHDRTISDIGDKTMREINNQDRPIGLIEEEKEPPNAMFYQNSDHQNYYEDKDDEEEEDYPEDDKI